MLPPSTVALPKRFLSFNASKTGPPVVYSLFLVSGRIVEDLCAFWDGEAEEGIGELLVGSDVLVVNDRQVTLEARKAGSHDLKRVLVDKECQVG